MIAMLWFSLGTSPRQTRLYNDDWHKAYYGGRVIPWLWWHYIRCIDGTQSQTTSSGQHLTLYLTWHLTHPQTQFAVHPLHCHSYCFNAGSLARLETSGDWGPFCASVSASSNARKRLLTLHITITDTGPEQSQIAVAFLSYREQNHKFVLCFLLLEPFMERGETLGMEIRYLSIGFKICYLPENFYQFFEVNNASKSSNTF